MVWKKIGYGNSENAYENKKGDIIFVDTHGSPVKNHKWIVVLHTWSSTSGVNERIIYHSDSEEKAVKYAKRRTGN
jgi:uncharacterized protein (UPF0276 family)